MTDLDIEGLLEPISVAAPCGENLERHPLFTALKQKAKIIPERQEGATVVPEQLPNWQEVRRDVLKLLADTKDLRLLVQLVRTNLNIEAEGINGLPGSLKLLLQSLESYWDSIHPLLDPEEGNNPTQRINILLELCGNGSVLRFLQSAPLVTSKVFGSYCYRDIQIAHGKTETTTEIHTATPDAIRTAFADAATKHPEGLQETHSALQTSIELIDKIEIFISNELEKLEFKNVPSFNPLRDKLQAAQSTMQEYMQQCGMDFGAAPASNAEATAETAEQILDIQPSKNSAPQSTFKPLAGVISNRQEVVRALDMICDYYAKFEPSSPLPLWAIRMKESVNKGFLEIIEDLEPNVLNQIKSHF